MCIVQPVSHLWFMSYMSVGYSYAPPVENNFLNGDKYSYLSYEATQSPELNVTKITEYFVATISTYI